MNNIANSKKHPLIYRLLGSLLALLILSGGMPVISVRAAALDYSPNYVTKITITTLTDADGWNGATATLYCRSRNGRGAEEKIAEWGIKSSIDDEGEVCDLVFSSPEHFPTKVVIWTDFGGGITWRSWEGAVKVYVNGINIKSEIIRSNSGMFISSNDTNTVTIDRSRYPYPERINVLTSYPSLSGLPDEEIFDTFYQGEGQTGCEGKAFLYAFDQYGKVWEENDIEVKNVSDPGSDSGSIRGGDRLDNAVHGNYAELRSDSGVDHRSTYEFIYPTNNSVYPTVSRTLDVDFVFRSSLDIVLQDETVFSGSDYKGKFINIPEDTPGVIAPAGYKITGFALTGAGTIADDGEGGYQYIYGTAPGTLTAKLTPIKYSIIFDGNGAQSGSVKKISNLAYEKMQKLPSCSFSRTGYKFTGWNTEPDGSGETFANVSFVSKLSADDGSTVTLYAQWEKLVYDVTLVYPEELGMADEILSVGYGDSVPVNEIIYYDSEDGHYEFVSSDKPLDDIKAKTTINLNYAKKAHTFGADNITKEPSCTSPGTKENVCEHCGYVRTSEIPADEHYHDYNSAKWEWSEDCRSAAVTVTCSHCGAALTGSTSENGSVGYTDSGAQRTYTASVAVDAGDMGLLTFENEKVCGNFLEQVSFIDENGLLKTIFAVPVTSSAVPDGSVYFVRGQIELSDELRFTDDTTLILCDGASLSVSTAGGEDSAISVYKPDPTGNNTGVLAIYGQEGQSGCLKVSGSGSIPTDSTLSVGIECGSYLQYGGVVDIDASSLAVHAEAPSAYGGGIEISGGRLDARSSKNDALLSEHGDVIITGGKVTTAAFWGKDGIVSAERSVTIGCEGSDDFISASSLHAADISVKDEQVLTDGIYYYSGKLNERQISALYGRKLSRFSGKVPSDTDMTAASASAVGTLVGGGSLLVVMIGAAIIFAALAIMVIVAIHRRNRRKKGDES